MTTDALHASQVVERQSWFQPTFTQGLLVGQASIVLLLLILLRFLLFADPSEVESEIARAKSGQGRKARSRRSFSALGKPSGHKRLRSKSDSAANVAATSAAEVSQVELAERGAAYDLGSHGPENSDWVNVLLALALHGYREDLNRAASGKSVNDGQDTLSGEEAKQVSQGINEVVESILNRAVDGKGGGIIVSPGVCSSWPKLAAPTLMGQRLGHPHVGPHRRFQRRHRLLFPKAVRGTGSAV